MLPRDEIYQGYSVKWLVNVDKNVALIQPLEGEGPWPEISVPLADGMRVLQERTHAAIDAALNVQNVIAETASQNSIPDYLVPTMGVSRQDGTPHIEVANAYHFVVCERGSERERRSTSDLDELLGWVRRAMDRSVG